MTDTSAPASSRCPGCGITLPACDGPVHRYMESSPACWAAYGELLSRDYSDPRYMAAHRVIVDAYAVQHPGQPSPQSIQSVAIHLIALHAIFECGDSYQQAMALLRPAADAGGFHWLTPPDSLGELTLLHPLTAQTPEAHYECSREWARSVWDAWAPHHPQIRAWAARHRRR